MGRCSVLTGSSKAGRCSPFLHERPRDSDSDFGDIIAPDADVVSADPGCQRVQNSTKPTRRANINHILAVRGIGSVEAQEFVETDIDNVLTLFGVFNEATHGLLAVTTSGGSRAFVNALKAGSCSCRLSQSSDARETAGVS
ncbi:hypothetical protein [Sinorhizobium sp. 7-81]|uniref:pPIWI-associating nuclease domain-containing protein n=1 Tax=Sinorhizobium sp. 7-81 TaxID=3049087 RepID=UPI0034DF0BCD